MGVDFYHSLPKAELHAHLNGSLSLETLAKLIELHKTLWPNENMPAEAELIMKKNATVDDPFKMFSIVHKVTDNPTSVSMATKDVIKDFADDGVKYLELRSTPRGVEGKMTKTEYCTSVLKEMVAARDDHNLDIMVKFIMAVDRRQLDTLEETHQLYERFSDSYSGLVVGLDISGDPRVGDLVSSIPRLKQLKASGVKLAVHLAEIPNHSETQAVLDQLVPDRLGHATCVHPDLGGCQALWDTIRRLRTPVEVCLTSNAVCKTVPSYDQHQAGLYHNAGVPIAISTDDKGVFSCSLSGEYRIAATTWNWDKQKVFSLSKEVLDHCFATDSEKKELESVWETWKKENMAWFS